MSGHIPRHGIRHLRWIREEGTQEPDGDELEREPEAIAIASAERDQALVLVIQVKVAGELLLRGLASVAPVGTPLLFGEKSYGHFRTTLLDNPLGEHE